MLQPTFSFDVVLLLPLLLAVAWVLLSDNSCS
jgi:hypothetical protein